jgi:hypothetical protein
MIRLIVLISLPLLTQALRSSSVPNLAHGIFLREAAERDGAVCLDGGCESCPRSINPQSADPSSGSPPFYAIRYATSLTNSTRYVFHIQGKGEAGDDFSNNLSLTTLPKRRRLVHQLE